VRQRGRIWSGVMVGLCAVMVAAGLAPTTVAADTGTPSTEAPAEVGTGVTNALAQHGTVDVFVMLDGHDASANVAALRQDADATEDRVVDALPSGVEVDERMQTVPAFTAHLTSTAELDALAAQPEVKRIDVDAGGGTGALANTVPIIGADVLHTAGYDGTGVTVAVLDSGADNDHPDLAGSVIHQACFGFNGGAGFCPNGTTRQVGAGAAEDNAGHGTHVTGIVRSAGNVSSVGVAPGVGIVSLKVTDGCSFSGCFYAFTEVTAALDYIAAHPELGVDVVNMSLQTSATYAGDCDSAASYLMAAAATVANLRAAGVTLVAASGNSSLATAMSAPACLSGVLSVAASNTTDAMASFANLSTTTDVVAPGVNVVSDLIGGGTVAASGTSMASPAVAGCVALLREARPTATVAQIESALKATGTPVTRGAITLPRINCDNALATLVVAPPACSFGITTAALPNATLGVPYSKQLSACSGGKVPYKWKKLSKLPQGLKLNAKTGLISGTPKKLRGTFSFTVQVRDSGKKAVRLSASKVLTIVVV
jgi:hypothetical protein